MWVVAFDKFLTISAAAQHTWKSRCPLPRWRSALFFSRICFFNPEVGGCLALLSISLSMAVTFLNLPLLHLTKLL